jgi:uncharacterized membrane protein YukC
MKKTIIINIIICIVYIILYIVSIKVAHNKGVKEGYKNCLNDNYYTIIPHN